MDAINVTAVTPQSAEYSCRLANEAKIPIQITESGIAEGKGKPFADIDFNWFDVYKVVADGLRKDVKGDLSVIWLQGFAGTPPVMQGDQGFKDAIAKLQGIKLATAPQDGQYATAPSLNITKTLVQSGLKFNVAIGGCQEITEGIIQALKEENVARDAVTVVTVNGGPMDVENFKKGNLDFALSQSPGLHGMINAANLLAYMNKQTYQKKSYSPGHLDQQDQLGAEAHPLGRGRELDAGRRRVREDRQVQARAAQVNPILFISGRGVSGGHSRGPPFHIQPIPARQDVAEGNILQALRVSKSYPGVQALDAVDFDLRHGEVQALVGQNGAGKSTFIEIVAGSLRPDSGQIVFEGAAYPCAGPLPVHRAGHPDRPPGEPAGGGALGRREHLPLQPAHQPGRPGELRRTAAGPRRRCWPSWGSTSPWGAS